MGLVVMTGNGINVVCVGQHISICVVTSFSSDILFLYMNSIEQRYAFNLACVYIFYGNQSERIGPTRSFFSF